MTKDVLDLVNFLDNGNHLHWGTTLWQTSGSTSVDDRQESVRPPTVPRRSCERTRLQRGRGKDGCSVARLCHGEGGYRTIRQELVNSIDGLSRHTQSNYNWSNVPSIRDEAPVPTAPRELRNRPVNYLINAACEPTVSPPTRQAQPEMRRQGNRTGSRAGRRTSCARPPAHSRRS
jgi:hypothetical protein